MKLYDWFKGVISKTIKSTLIEATNGKICAGLKRKNHKPFPNIVNEFVGDKLVALFNKSYDLEFVFFIKKQWTSDYLRALNPPIRSSEINYPPIGFEDFIFTARTIFWWPKMTNFTAVITINNDFLAPQNTYGLEIFVKTSFLMLIKITQRVLKTLRCFENMLQEFV